MIFNKAFDQRPAVIVRCVGASDVARALDFAQKKNLPLAKYDPNNVLRLNQNIKAG